MLTLRTQKKELMPCYFIEQNGVTIWNVDYKQFLVKWLPSVAGPEKGLAAFYEMFTNENGAAANNPAEPAKAGDSI